MIDGKIFWERFDPLFCGQFDNLGIIIAKIKISWSILHLKQIGMDQ